MNLSEKRKALEALYPLWKKAEAREGRCPCRACWERLLEQRFNFDDHALKIVHDVRTA